MKFAGPLVGYAIGAAASSLRSKYEKVEGGPSADKARQALQVCFQRKHKCFSSKLVGVVCMVQMPYVCNQMRVCAELQKFTGSQALRGELKQRNSSYVLGDLTYADFAMAVTFQCVTALASARAQCGTVTGSAQLEAPTLKCASLHSATCTHASQLGALLRFARQNRP